MKKTKTTIAQKHKKQLTRRKYYKKYLALLVVLGVIVFFVYRGAVLLNSTHFSPLNKIKQAQADAIDIRDYFCDSPQDDASTGPHTTFIAPSKETSEKYRKNLISGNQVVNSELTQEPGIINATGFEKTQDQYPGSSLVRIIDSNGRPFMRSEVKQHDAQTPSIAWLMQAVTIKNAAYYYSLEYKSTDKTLLEVVATDKQGKDRYFGVGQAEATNNWTRIEGHFPNYDGTYSSIKIVARPLETGITDIRSLHIAELRDTRPETAIISVTFDDGWSSIYKNGLPLFKKYNLPTTQFVISGQSIKRVNNYMTFEQLSKMQNAGHEISSHSLKHCNLSTLSADDLSYDLSTSKSLLQDKKLNTEGIAYPYGSYSPQVGSKAQTLYSYARTTDEGYNDSYVDRYLIKTQNVDSDTTIQEVNSWIEYAKQNRLWLIFVYHQVGESGQYNVTVDQLENDLRVIKESGLPVKTVRDSLVFLDN